MNDILNVEVKSRCENIGFIEEKLLSLGASFIGLDHQVDTYFNTPSGRLKLRSGNIENTLIFYNRSNDPSLRESSIILEKLLPGNRIKDILSGSIGVKTIVDKKRKIFFIDNVKFHIDEVLGLGNFVEIEAIDSTGERTSEYLKKQCEYFTEALCLKKKDFLSLSYSDLVTEAFLERIEREAISFLKLLSRELETENLSLAKDKIDHLCYRVTSLSEYEAYRKGFSKMGDLLIESQIGGRSISTYKLFSPIRFNGFAVDVIELPSPKEDRYYSLGFEHAEFVIEDSFECFISKHKKLEFDLTSIEKKINPDIRLLFKTGLAIKLHHQSLEAVISVERSRL